AGAGDRRGVADVPLLKLDVGRHLGQVLALAREEVVEDAHLVAARQERAHDPGTDETGAAGDEVRAWHAAQPIRTGAQRTSSPEMSGWKSLVVSAGPWTGNRPSTCPRRNSRCGPIWRGASRSGWPAGRRSASTSGSWKRACATRRPNTSCTTVRPTRPARFTTAPR